jgi:hypothetical protein
LLGAMQAGEAPGAGAPGAAAPFDAAAEQAAALAACVEGVAQPYDAARERVQTALTELKCVPDCGPRRGVSCRLT